jgi:hypothetical protein
MAVAIEWTPEQDETIRRLRLEGQTWAEIAKVFGVAGTTVSDHGNRIGAIGGPPPMHPKPKPERGKEPLSVGHPISWGVLVAGTMLDDAR